MKSQLKSKIDTKIAEDPNASTGVHVVKTATCPNLAGKAKLVYQIGRSPEGRVQVRVTKNSSSGCFSDEWFDLETIWKELAKNSPNDGPVTSADSMKLFVGRSQNTCGFVFAALKAEGLVVASRQRRRSYDRIDNASFEVKCKALLEGSAAKSDRPRRVGRNSVDTAKTKRTAKTPRK